MITLDFIWQNFGVIEWVLCTELVVLLAAGFFYQVARVLVRTDRHDPVIRFYRVFWKSFFAPVPSIRALDARQAEAIARAAGLRSAGDMDDEQLARLDAPDLADVGDPIESPQSAVRVIGRQAPDPDDSPIASKPASPRRELRPEPRTIMCSLDVRVEGPKSASGIVGVVAGELVINVTCPPEEGMSNGLVIELVAARVGLQPYQITLLRGHYKVRKTIQIAGIDPATLAQCLENR